VAVLLNTTLGAARANRLSAAVSVWSHFRLAHVVHLPELITPWLAGSVGAGAEPPFDVAEQICLVFTDPGHMAVRPQ
jgi:hypothetical protein